MRCIVFELEQFKEDLSRHGLQKQYDVFKEKVERGEVTFDSIRNILKTGKLGYNLRLIAWDGTNELLSNGQEPRLIVFLKLYAKKDRDYNQFTDNVNKKGSLEIRDKLIHQLTPELKDSLKAAYEEETKPKVITKPALPEEFYPWVELEKWRDKTGSLDIGFCESIEWSKDIKKMGAYLNVFNELLLEIINGLINTDLEKETSNFQNLHTVSDGRCMIFYSLHRSEQGVIVFLVKPVILNQSINLKVIENELGKKYKGIFSKDNLHIDDVFKYSKQAYPSDTILDNELWFQIENEEEKHPALSTEEENILMSISGPGGKSLPIFINGRAGSGKSTLLQYIFCLFAKKQFNGLEGSILYLTYSEQLRKNAADLCSRILKNHYNFVKKASDANQDQEIEFFIKNSFRTFHDLLLDILLPQERDKFSESRRVSFYHFKNHFFPFLRTQVKCAPETAWHIIRAYIKGRETSAELDPRDYKKIPAKDQTVEFDTYQIVYEKIWPQYKKYLDENNRWDDLDLVSRVLWLIDFDKKVAETNKYTAIFCDEAQDFTKNELSLILRLSLFSKYDLSKSKKEITGLPFAFAGDPLQTITPTGFSWDRFTSSFYDVLVEQLGIEDAQPFLKDKLVELKYNYRSNEGIVKFSNLIQFLRFTLLKESCSPQKSWREDYLAQDSSSQPGSVPKYFVFSKNLSKEDFKKNARYSVIILPSEEGALNEFIENDSTLKEMMESEQGEIAFEDAISSKGLEMDKVIVYKFGHHLKNAKKLWHKDFLDEDQLVYYRYFFNRLYVAVTRARKQLNIVDTEEGYEKFWSKLYEQELSALSNFNDWNEQDCFIYLLKGTEACDLIEEKPLNVAKMYKEAGIKERNPKHMAKAASIFSSQGQEEAQECEAYVLWYSGDHRKAGISFLQIKTSSEEAKECFWEGEVWDLLERWYSKNSDITDEDRSKRQLAKFWIAIDKQSKSNILKHGINIFQRGLLSKDRLLNERYNTAEQAFLTWLENSIDLLDKNECLKVANLIENREDDQLVELSLQLLFKADEHLRVLKISEEKDINDSRYYESKLQITDSTEEKIMCLLSLNRTEEALVIYQEEKDEIKNKYLLTKILEVYKDRNNFEEASRIYSTLKEPLNALNQIINHIDNISKEFSDEYLGLLISQCLNNGHLNKLMSDVLKTKDQKVLLSLLPPLFSSIASKEIDNEDLNPPHKLVNEFFAKTRNIVVNQLTYEHIICASLAYERIDCLRKDLLSYYEEVLDKPDLKPKFMTFIQARWLYIKNKHITGKAKFKEDSRQELEEKQKEWGIEKIPASIPYFEDVLKRIDKKHINRAVETLKKEKPMINLKPDEDDNFEHDEILKGEVNIKKSETRLHLTFKTKPDSIIFEVDDNRFKLILKPTNSS